MIAGFLNHPQNSLLVHQNLSKKPSFFEGPALGICFFLSFKLVCDQVYGSLESRNDCKRPDSCNDNVDGSEILNQLGLVVYPIIYRLFFTSEVVQDFFHQQYPKAFFGGRGASCTSRNAHIFLDRRFYP